MRVKIWRMLPLLLLIGLLPAQRLFALEHWAVASATPWETGKSIASFNGYILVSGLDSRTENCLWRSQDGNSWTSVSLPITGPDQRYVASFCEHQQKLYGFVVSIATTASGFINYMNVYRTTDGLNWSKADNGEFAGDLGLWSDSISSGPYLYAGDFKSQVWRTDGTGAVPTWTKTATLQVAATGVSRTSFSVFNGSLLAAVATDNVFTKFTSVFILQGATWNQLPNRLEDGELMRAGSVVFDNALYWAGNYLRKTLGSSSNFVWEKITAGVLPVPFVLNNQLHAYGPSAQILAMSGSGVWQDVAGSIPTVCAGSEPAYGKPAHLGETTLILPCDLLMFRNGLVSAVRGNFIPAVRTPSETKAPVLTWSAQVNSSETLQKLRVVNLGTAQQTLDIMRVSLVRSVSGQPNSTALVDLEPLAGGAGWETPTGFSLPVADGDSFFITVDISVAPTDGATLQFSIPTNGFSWKINPGWIPAGPLTESTAQSIKLPLAQAVAPLEGVTSFPSPASDTVRFLYSLSSAADVTIDVFDRNGQTVAQLSEPGKPADLRAVTIWDARSTAPGVYMARIKINESQGGQRLIKKKIVIER